MSETFELSATSPAEAGTVPSVYASGLARYSGLRVEARLLGATGDTLDVYLQRKVGPDLWVDWAHFPQLLAGASAVAYSFAVQNGTPSSGTIAAITTRGSDAVPSPGLADATLDLVHPGDHVRLVFVAGASTSAGAAQRVLITGIGPSR
ncbi:MAG TPA: hypothetical protein VFR23_24770 [Jiangellaceae bacterium]|nr:hypothetical protein [Jiangellaceae bacterium]